MSRATWYVTVYESTTDPETGQPKLGELVFSAENVVCQVALRLQHEWNEKGYHAIVSNR